MKKVFPINIVVGIITWTSIFKYKLNGYFW